MVGREGFEPSKAEPPDLQSGAFGHFATDPCVADTNVTEREHVKKPIVEASDFYSLMKIAVIFNRRHVKSHELL